MNKVKNGRLYDTEAAKKLGSCDNGYYGDDLHEEHEVLYQKRSGEFFLVAGGGPLSSYAEPYGNGFIGSEDIYPLQREGAREWAEEHLSVEAYVDAFGPVSE